MLTLDINKYKSISEKFRDTYKQSLLDAINDKKSDLGLFGDILDEIFLDKLLLYTPKKQKQLIKIALKKYTNLSDKNSKMIEALKYIFIEQGYEKIDKKAFYNDMDIVSCIYCNRNYIFNLDENGHIKGHIDHFYDKATYPFLAMSFYNLIPSCETCNKVKGSYNTYTNNSKNPYQRDDERVFKIKVKSSNTFEYELEDDDLMKKLYMQEIYNVGHKDILNDMYVKFYQEETKAHFDILKNEFKSLDMSDDDIHRYLTCGYLDKDEFHKKTHSKLIKDISKELELIK